MARGQAESRESLRTGVFYALTANLLYAGMQWGIICILAKAGSLTLLGEYAYCMAVIAPFLTLLNLNLRAVQVADYEGRHTPGDYWDLRRATTLVGCLFFPVLGMVVADSGAMVVAFAAIGLFRSLEGLMDLTHGWFQKARQMHLVCRSMAVRTLVSMAGFALVMAWRPDLALAFVVLSVAVLAVVIGHDLPLVKKAAVLGRGSSSGVRALAIRCLPLTLGLVFNTLQTSGPRVILKSFRGVEEVGVFAALSYFVVVGGTLVTAVGAVASPRIAQWYSEGATREITRLTWRILLIDLGLGLGLFLVLGWFARPIFHVLISAEVAEFSELGIWIAVAAGLYFVECHLGVAVTSMNILKEQVPAQIVKLAAALILAAVLIPLYGVYGAIWSVIVSSAVAVILFAGMFRQGLKRRQRASGEPIRGSLCNRDA